MAAPNFDAIFDSHLNGMGGETVVLDMNHDGDPDIAVSGHSGVTTLLGRGDGRFDQVGTYAATGSYQGTIATGDLNGDGNADLIAGENGGLEILLGDGAGGFTTSTVANYSHYVVDLALADFNKDGKIDALTAESEYIGDYTTSALSLLLGDGTGKLYPDQRFDVHNAGSIAVGDFNGDGFPDMAANNSLGYDRVRSLSVYLNDGTGTLIAGQSFAEESDARRIVSADVNSDGKLDLLFTAYSLNRASTESFMNIGVRLGDGKGGFGTEQRFFAGGQGGYSGGLIATGDFNRDGKLDVVAAEQPDILDEQTNTVRLLLGDGTGSFGKYQNYARGARPAGLIVADLNLDGNLDVAVTDEAFDTLSISTLVGDGKGHLQDGKYRRLPWYYETIATADFNGDGREDLVATNNRLEGLSVLPGKGSGFGDLIPFQMAPKVCGQCAPEVGPIYVYPADFNNDGKPDVATVNFYGSSISILLGDGAGSFKQRRDYPFYGGAPLATGDFNGDGNQDVVALLQGSPYIYVRYGDGRGRLGDLENVTISESGGGSHAGSAALLNADKISDLALMTSEGVALLFGTPDGKFDRHVLAGIRGQPFAADLNGDHLMDLVVTYAQYDDPVQSTTILLGDGQGAFHQVWSYPSAFGPVGAADFNGDGFMDLLAYDSGSLGVLVGDGSGQFSEPIDFGPFGQSVIVDFNHDGQPDVVSEIRYGFNLLMNTTGKCAVDDNSAELRGEWLPVKGRKCRDGAVCTARATVEVKNGGCSDAGPFDVQFYLSADDQLTTDDRVVATRRVLKLAGGRSRRISVRAELPVESNTSTTLFAAIDALDAVAEQNESDNLIGMDWR